MTKFKEVLLLIVSVLFVFTIICQTTEATDFPVDGINKSKKKKIVFVAGTDSHGNGEHEFILGCRLLAKFLNESRADVLAVVAENGWPKNLSIFDGSDVIVMYSDGGDDHMILPHLEEVDKLVKKGVGMVVVHYAIEVPKGRAGDYFTSWLGGYFEENYSVNPIFTPKLLELPKHPITNGIKLFELRDEWYYHIRFSENSKIIPILTTHPPLSTLTKEFSTHGNNQYVKEDVMHCKVQTLAWGLERKDGGRSFSITGAHYYDNWKNDDFRKLVLNAILWTSKIEVPKNGLATSMPSISKTQ